MRSEGPAPHDGGEGEPASPAKTKTPRGGRKRAASERSVGGTVVRSLAWFLGGLVALGGVIAVLLWFALQAGPGQGFVLRTALRQADAFVTGEIQVAGIRSESLLRGFLLHGVRIVDDRGRPILEADSLAVGYSIRALLRRDIELVPTQAWAPRVVLETLAGDTLSNLDRIFARPPPPEPRPDVDDEPEGRGLRLALRNVTVHDGEFLFRVPATEEELAGRGVFDTVPGFEGPHRVVRLWELEARIDDANVLDRDRPGQHITVRSLSASIRALDEPFRIADFRGEVRRVGARLEVEADQIWLTGTELDGRFALDWSDEERGMTLEASLDADPLLLEDFRWIEPRLPEGEGRLALQGEGPLTSGSWRVRDLDLQSGASRVRGSVGFDLEDGLHLAGTDLELLPLELALLEPWLDDPLPVEGRLRGRMRATGPLGGLRLDGEMTFDDPAREIPASTARIAGVVRLGEIPSVADLTLTVDPLRYETLRAFAPDLEVRGTGSLRAHGSGSLPAGLLLTANLEHSVDGGPVTRVVAAGSIRDVEGDLRLALEGSVAPLSFEGLAAGLDRELPLRGDVRGQVRAEGFLSDLLIDARLTTPGGPADVTVRTDVRDPARGYVASGATTGLDLTAFVADAPDPSRLRGTFRFEGRGLDLETVEGEGEAAIDDSRYGEIVVERARARLEARDGRLLVRELEVRSPLADLDGEGDLALRATAPDGELRIAWRAPTLSNLGPLLLEEVPIAADTLTDVEREILFWEGIDPDTLPGAAGPRLGGSASGLLHLRGRLSDLRAEGTADLLDVVWLDGRLARGHANVRARLDGTELIDADGEIDLEGIAWDRWAFDRVSGDVRYEPGSGAAQLDLLRRDNEEYRVEGSFTHDTIATEVSLTTVRMELDDVEWNLVRPARIRVEGTRIALGPLEVSRPDTDGNGPVRVRVDGVLDLDGDSDLRVDAQGVDLDRLARVLQFDPAPAGILDLDLTVTGHATAPEMDGNILIRDLDVDGTRVSRVEGTIGYRDRRVQTQLGVDHEGRRLLTLSGIYPIDLAFQGVEDRFPDREVDLAVEIDELPAATLLAFLDVLEEVEGTLSGRLQFRGEPRDLQPSGSLSLRDGGLLLGEIGLHPRGIQAVFTVEPDGVIRVAAEARARGAAIVSGTIDLSDITNPGFDLAVRANGFQAAERRDLEARIGGEMTLTGAFRQPLVRGNVRVEQGAIYLEEIARTAEVVDLADPRFFDVVDTTLVALRPAAESAQNPFLQNLRVEVDMDIQRDFWLRSREMNVEIGGQLFVTFDRPERELLLVGTLQAIRGSYAQFGRQFQVRGGSVEFMGTPGIDPALDLDAVTRLRREGGEPLEITANVGGTLTSPRVTLGSDSQPPIAQSDLISYLIFGRPSYALASGETSILEGAAGAGVAVGLGTIATQLSAVVSRQIGLDYFAITQTSDVHGTGTLGGLGGNVAETQIELGQYLSQNIFLALVLRPLRGVGGSQATIPGARIEWRFTDTWTAEAFVEDRFGREGVFTFGDLGLRLNRIFGLELYREWGY